MKEKYKSPMEIYINEDARFASLRAKRSNRSAAELGVANPALHDSTCGAEAKHPIGMHRSVEPPPTHISPASRR
ncbi:MAG: hypothetical protein LBT94_00495, partial [Prevotellaceae bacterium]|nr:hypothetical protein [Prevotellaceae bacterium]